MSFSTQKQILTTQASAVQGDKAALHSVYYPIQLMADADGVTAGYFVWIDSNGDATANVGTGKPVGLVERNLSHYILNPKVEGTLVVPDGDVVTLAVKGSYWVKCSSSAVVGEKIFAGKNDIKSAASGTLIAGYVETDWQTITAGNHNDLIIISNF